jgi:hypothetical protein
MQTARYAFGTILLAAVTIAVGLVLFERSIVSAQNGSFVRLAALLLLIYGAILLWWRVEAAAPALQARITRVVRRAL